MSDVFKRLNIDEYFDSIDAMVLCSDVKLWAIENKKLIKSLSMCPANIDYLDSVWDKMPKKVRKTFLKYACSKKIEKKSRGSVRVVSAIIRKFSRDVLSMLANENK